MASLNSIIQEKKKNLKEYVERFTREGVEVHGAQDSLKCFIFERTSATTASLRKSLALGGQKT
jgi:hypothetical protein